MCGRFSIATDATVLKNRFQAEFSNEDTDNNYQLPNYNVAPTQFVPVLKGDRSYFTMMKWGLIPSWSKGIRMGTQLISARIETINDKPSFKNLLHHGRCIIPMDGFYEWKKYGKTKVPYRIFATDQALFSVAGLCTTWTNPADMKIVNSFAIITLSANTFMASIHTRMPAILTPHKEKFWLDYNLPSQEALQLLTPYPSEHLNYFQVFSKINSVYERGKDIMNPILPNDEGNNGKQLSLF